MRILKTTCLAALTALSLSVHAVTVKHEQGELTLDKTPERIVVLELSFADEGHFDSSWGLASPLM